MAGGICYSYRNESNESAFEWRGAPRFGEMTVASRVALIGIIVENRESVEALNAVLHEFGQYIVGRMGIPYRERNINIISVAVDAPQDVINALSGKIGKLVGVTAKAVYSNVTAP